MEYNFRTIEQEWKKKWAASGAYQVNNVSSKPKFYVLDMFPYPSGVGLHVGHPLGYIASDIYARYKRLKGFNVLHPMGYDSFGLPAEQYALETGQHPAVTTEKNIDTFRKQMDKIGFSFDWSREVRTSDPHYYKWTQWIFLQLFGSWYNVSNNKAESIDTLVALFEKQGTSFPGHNGPSQFSAAEWAARSEDEQQQVLMDYRLAYSSYGEVNWCEALGTVLANDEVVNGVSERGGFPVIKKKMRQWYLRITNYADRLLEGLEKVAFSESLKEQQRNWIGKSQGAEISFALDFSQQNLSAAGYTAASPAATESNKNDTGALTVYTTRPDTIFGVDFMVIAPEHELVEKITTPEQHDAVDSYLEYVKSRTDRERMAEVKQITGCFTGAYAINPFDGRKIPVWIAEYVLAGYGTGAIMAVPCGDERDFNFARHFSIPITNIIGDSYDGTAANPTKDARLTNSGFLTGMIMRDAIDVVITKLVEMGIGKRQINYKMRDAGFSRQRYWGEPFPIVWQDGLPWALPETELPVKLPHVDRYGPGPQGEGPLANLQDWVSSAPPVKADGSAPMRETSTMPGYAGSSWYFLRYMDPHNDQAFCDRAASDYWNQVDVYVGGTEHAVGHLLYSRMWTKFLYDRGWISFDEPYKRLVNQGMITGRSYFLMQDDTQSKAIVSYKKTDGNTSFIRFKFGHNYVDGTGRLTKKMFQKYLADHNLPADEFSITWENDGTEDFILTKEESEKMSKSKYNVDNPDDLVERFGADTFRMYEMFLGPVEASKPWDTKGIEGVHRFLKKLWRLFFDETKGAIWNEDAPTAAELRILHKTIRKVEEDTERFSFNTAVSTFMICVNELTDIRCNKKAVLEPLLILLTPYAPHIAEELWHQLGNNTSVLDAPYPVFEASHVTEHSKEYPVSVNGKVRTSINIALDAAQNDIEEIILSNDIIKKWLEGRPPKKIIYVKNKMVNVVV